MFSANGSNGATGARPIRGRSLVHRRRDKRQLAALAADVLAGLAAFEPSRRQLSTSFGVSVTYIAAAARLTPEQRKAIIEGRDSTSFRTLLNPPEPQFALPAPKAVLDDAQVIGFVRSVGVTRVLDAAVLIEAAQ
jgi:hypothetical protein